MRIHNKVLCSLTLLSTLMVAAGPAYSVPVPVDPWPAEPHSQAVNLSGLHGSFGQDLSDVYWNNSTQKMWLIANNGKLTAIEKSTAPGNIGGWAVAKNSSNQLCHSTQYSIPGGGTAGYGDSEALVFANEDNNILYIMIEGADRIKAFDVSNCAAPVLLRDYNLAALGVMPSGSGSEGLTFVPNEHLQAIGFLADNAAGQAAPRIGTGGTGGLFFVGSQVDGGDSYVFDADANSNSITYVGRYDFDSRFPETASLSFDRTTGLLYAMHDNNMAFNKLEVSDLRSVRTGTKRYQLVTKKMYSMGYTPPGGTSGIEGIHVFPVSTCSENGGRPIVITIDNGGANSLFLYNQFTDGCGTFTCTTSNDCPGGQLCNTYSNECFKCPMDFTDGGFIDSADYNAVAACAGSCYPADHACRSKNLSGDFEGCIEDKDLQVVAECNNMNGPGCGYEACYSAKKRMAFQFDAPPPPPPPVVPDPIKPPVVVPAGPVAPVESVTDTSGAALNAVSAPLTTGSAKAGAKTPVTKNLKQPAKTQTKDTAKTLSR